MDRFKQGLKNTVAAVPTNKEAALSAKDDFARELEQFDSLAKLEEKTGRSRVELVGVALAGFVGIMFLSVFVRPLGELTTRLFCFTLPALKSFKAIEGGAQTAESRHDMTQWLSYWFIFAVVTLTEETLMLPFQESAWMPVWFLVKIGFFGWLMLPTTHGAELVYTEFMRPRLLELQEKMRKPKEE